MIVTRNWLQEFIDISHISTSDICKALNSIGLEVDSVRKIFIPNGVVVGKVLECNKHPDANKLNVCKVDIGNKIVQIVCGASNVKKDQFVPVATVGTNLTHELTIKETILRGVPSVGMICSTQEIGLPLLNNGILELDDSIGKLILGKDLNEYPILNFESIEIELTANRGDCLSINGIARELSTYFNIAFYKFEVATISNEIGIGQVLDIKSDDIYDSNLIYKAANIHNFRLPLLYKLRTALLGINKDTDIETAIAYATHATGVLLNVYTKAIATTSLQNDKVSLRITKDDDGFDTIVGKVILSTIGVEAGHISVEDDIVILEASYTNPELLSQKVFDAKKKTSDIYYKASRGSEPNLTLGIGYLINLLSSFGATIYNGEKQYIDNVQENRLTVNITKINSIIGQNIPKDKMVSILTSLGFIVRNSRSSTLSIVIPNFRHDIKNIADITEEIVRIIGIDNIKAKPLIMDEKDRSNKTSNLLISYNKLRTKAINNNFFETITYIFTQKLLLEKYKCDVVDENLDILNPITNELNTFRTTLSLNLLQAVKYNVKQGAKSIALFEIGTVFNKKRDENKSMGLIFSGEKELESIANAGKPKDIDFFNFSQKITNIIGEFELKPMEKLCNNFIHPYQNANIIIEDINIGEVYKIHPNIAKDFDISKNTFIALIDLNKILNRTIQVVQISKFQYSKRDLSIVAPKDLEYSKIKQTINSLDIKEIKQFNLVDIYSDDKLKNNESLTIKFILQSYKKTLDEEEITKIMDKILTNLNDKLDIGIR